MTVPRSEMITYLVPGQVAELLEVSENTVYRRAKQDPSGELPASHRARLSSNRFRRQGSGDVNVRLRWDDQASYYRGTARPISTSLRLRLSIPQGTEPAVCPCGHRAGRHCGRGLLPDLGVSRSPAMKLPALRRGGQRDDDVILASGESDALALLTMGFENVVAVTTGESSLPASAVDALAQKQRVLIIAFDRPCWTTRSSSPCLRC